MLKATHIDSDSRRASAGSKTLAGLALVSVLCTGGWIHAQTQSEGKRYLAYVDKDIDLVFKSDLGLKRKVQTLLGSNYSAFMARMETTGGADKVQNFVVFKGCKAHECGLDEAYLLLDTDSGKMYAAIYSNAYGAKNPKRFSENPADFPSKVLDSLRQQ